jgi:hypothetical protein
MREAAYAHPHSGARDQLVCPDAEKEIVMAFTTSAPMPRADRRKDGRGLRPRLFLYRRRLIRTLRAHAPYLVPVVMLVTGAELAVRRKLLPRTKRTTKSLKPARR